MEELSIAQLKRITMRMVLFILICFILIYAKTLLIPLAWALMISLASERFVTKMKVKTKLPSILVVLIYMIALFAAIGCIFFFFTIELQVLLSDVGLMQEKLSNIMYNLSYQLKGIGFNIPDHYDSEYFKGILKEHNNTILNMVSGIGASLWDFILIIFYTFFFLINKDLVNNFVEKKYKNHDDKEKIKKLIAQIIGISQEYVRGMFLLGLIIGIMSYFLFIAFGIKAALFFSIFFGILSLIPVIGVPLGMIIIAFFALLSKDSAMTAIYVAGALFILNFLQDNIFRPVLMGSKLSVNSFAVFFFVILGGFFWGVSGMILFIPIASIIKIILECTETGAAYSVFLSENQRKEKPAKKTIPLKKQQV